MTLSKLAKIAHVSVSTVSKAFSASPEVSPETRKYIFDLAREHGCFEKYYKEKYDKKVIAVVCPEIKSAYYAEFVSLLEKKITEKNYTMLLSISNFDLQKEMDIVYYYRCFAKVNGVIVMGGLKGLCSSEGIPTVGIFSDGEVRNDMDIITLGWSGIQEAVSYLKECGHKDIAFIGERHTLFKQQNFVSAMEEFGLPVREEFLITSDSRFEQAGAECAAALLQLKELPTAVIAAYDYMAFGAIDYWNAHGFKVPEELSVIGIDDIAAANYGAIQLTSVKTDFERVCQMALEMLEEKMQNPQMKTYRHKTADSVLVKRNSVVCVKRN